MKNIRNKIIISVVILFAMIFGNNLKIFGVESGLGTFSKLYVGVKEHDDVYGHEALYYYTLDGNFAYCLEMAMIVYKDEYVPSEYNNPQIAYALNATHEYMNNTAANYQIRQAVIWALLGQANIENLYAGDIGCVNVAKRIYYEAIEYAGTVDGPNVSDTNLYFHIEGMQYVSNTVRISKPENADYYDMLLNGLPAGSYISDEAGNPVSVSGLTTDSVIQVRIPLENIWSDISVIDFVAQSTGTVLKTGNAYFSTTMPSQPLLVPEVSTGTSQERTRFNLATVIHAVGALEIKKVDEYNNPIPGTTFKLYNDHYEQVQVTGANGIARFNDVPPGNYTVEETSASYGYFNDRVPINARIITGLTVETSKGNRPARGRVKIVKRDKDTGERPQGDGNFGGAEYKIYAKENIYTPNGSTLLYSAGAEVATLVTNDNGISNTVDLPLGTYRYRETKASTGYLKNEEDTTFSITYDGQYVELKDISLHSSETIITNDIEIIKKLQKTDCTPQMNLSGSKFSATLKSDRSKVYYSTVTDDRGYCIIRDLPYGTYEIEEVVVPSLALKVDNFDVFVEEDSSVRTAYKYTIEDVSKKMKIIVHKEDIETGNITQGDAKFDGAEYTIYRDEALTDAIETVTIRNGKAESKWYLVGTYYVKETKRPEGYLIDEQVYRVVQIPEQQTVEFSYHDITSRELVEKGDIYLVKFVDNNTNTDKEGPTTKPAASGVELTLTLNSNENTKYKAVIQDNGYAEFKNIPYGWYTITETKSLEFVDIMDPQNVYVSYNGQKFHYIIEDPREERKLKIVKKDIETGKTIPLSGATFKVYDIVGRDYLKQTINYPEEITIEEFTTGADGTLILPEGIIPGEYELREITAPYGYVLNRERIRFRVEATTPQNPEFIEVTVTEFSDKPQKAKVVVYKKGEVLTSTRQEDDMTRPVYEEKGLDGVEYTITATSDIVTPDGTIRMRQGETVTFTTGEDGVGTSPELYLGAYSIRESKTVDGYTLNLEEIPFVLDYKGQEIEIYYKRLEYNDIRQKLQVTLNKTMEKSNYKDILDNAYKDVVLGIYTQEDLKNYKGRKIIEKDTLVDKLYITENGTNTSNYDLPLGKYYIKEIATNENYILNEEEYPFEFVVEDNIQPIIDINIESMINNDLDELTKLRIVKLAVEKRTTLQRIGDLFTGYNPDSKKHTISDVKFKLYYDVNGEPKELFTIDNNSKYKTNDKGIIEIDNLPYGKYYYQETEVPFGFELDNSLHEFNITKEDGNGKLVEIEVENKIVEKRLFTKKDAFTSQLIPDCTFEILNEDKELIYTNKTNEKGDYYISIDLLEPGKMYYYHEISAPEIYQLNDELHEFIVNEDYSINVTEVENLRKTSRVKISKSDFISGEKIPNCEFELKSLETNKIWSGVTDENGEFFFEDIPYGEYTYTEISAPSNYNLDTTPHRITIDAEEIAINISNEKYINTGDIRFTSIIIIVALSIYGMIWLVYKKQEQ